MIDREPPSTYTRAAAARAAETFDNAAQAETIRDIGPAVDADILTILNRVTGYFGSTVLYMLALIDDVAQGTAIAMSEEYKQDRERAFDAIKQWTVLLNNAIRQGRRLSWPIIIILCVTIYIAFVVTGLLIVDVARLVQPQ